MMAIKFFITGTDTGVGKTYVSTGLLRKFNSKGMSTFAMKPIASGCRQSCQITGQLYNEDALALQATASIKKMYTEVNPIALEPPIAPHVAAQWNNQRLSKQAVVKIIEQSFVISADVLIIEGVGGWFVPLNESELISDVVETLKIPVILVVGIKLGCLNHAILTARAISEARLCFAGWIANCLTPEMIAVDENIHTLRQWIRAPCLGVIPYGGIVEFSTDLSKVVSPEENIFSELFNNRNTK